MYVFFYLHCLHAFWITLAPRIMTAMVSTLTVLFFVVLSIADGSTIKDNNGYNSYNKDPAGITTIDVQAPLYNFAIQLGNGVKQTGNNWKSFDASGMLVYIV